MSRSLTPQLLYGYDLGGADEGWKLRDAGKYGDFPKLSWYSDEDADYYGIIELMTERLIVEIGKFTEADDSVEGYFERKQTAEMKVGVYFECYGVSDFPDWILTTGGISATSLINPGYLTMAPHADGWDKKLNRALEVLELKPTQEYPGWFLSAYYG